MFPFMIHVILAAHKQMGGFDIFQPDDSKSWTFTPVTNETKIVLSLDAILQTMMVIKVNFKRSNGTSGEDGGIGKS